MAPLGWAGAATLALAGLSRLAGAEEQATRRLAELVRGQRAAVAVHRSDEHRGADEHRATGDHRGHDDPADDPGPADDPKDGPPGSIGGC
ncbi:MAG: hypothetical protein ACRDY0_08785 [Acidimicrobiales bacterium]